METENSTHLEVLALRLLAEGPIFEGAPVQGLGLLDLKIVISWSQHHINQVEVKLLLAKV
jgi:hypothetical protein